MYTLIPSVIEKMFWLLWGTIRSIRRQSSITIQSHDDFKQHMYVWCSLTSTFVKQAYSFYLRQWSHQQTCVVLSALDLQRCSGTMVWHPALYEHAVLPLRYKSKGPLFCSRVREQHVRTLIWYDHMDSTMNYPLIAYSITRTLNHFLTVS